MPKKVGRQEASCMLNLMFAVVFLLALSLIVMGIARAISRRGTPRGYYSLGPEPWSEILLGVFATVFVVAGYLVARQEQQEAKIVGIFLALSGGGCALFCQSAYPFFRPRLKDAQKQHPKVGWEVSFGQAIWTNDWRPSAPSVFGVWRQLLGLVHFVDGIKVLHFRGDCDNGGKIEVKLVLVPSSAEVAPIKYWDAVAVGRRTYSELVAAQAVGARSPMDINLSVYSHRALKLHPDTDIAYTPSPKHWKPFATTA